MGVGILPPSFVDSRRDADLRRSPFTAVRRHCRRMLSGTMARVHRLRSSRCDHHGLTVLRWLEISVMRRHRGHRR